MNVFVGHFRKEGAKNPENITMDLQVLLRNPEDDERDQTATGALILGYG